MFGSVNLASWTFVATFRLFMIENRAQRVAPPILGLTASDGYSTPALAAVYGRVL